MPQPPAFDYSALASLRRELASAEDDRAWSLDMFYEVLADLPAGATDDDYCHWTDLPGPLGVLEAAVGLGYARRGRDEDDMSEWYALTALGHDLVETLKPIVMAIGAQRHDAEHEDTDDCGAAAGAPEGRSPQAGVSTPDPDPDADPGGDA